MFERNVLIMEDQTKKKSNIFQWAALAFEFSFMLCLFAPIDIFFANKDEYWFTFGQLMSVTAIAFVAIFSVISVCLWGLSKIKVFNYIYAACTCVLLYLYVQGNYIPRNYGVLNGNKIDWASYTGYGIASIVLAVVSIALCVVICIKFKERIFDIGKWVSIFLFLIQFVTIGTLLVQNIDYLKKSSENSFINTDKGLYEVSADNNVIVFILDTFDGSDMSYLLDNDYDKYSAVFEDFTFYKDTLGAYPTTKSSMPYILTGRWYENAEPYNQYITTAYTDNLVYNTFIKNKFELDIYTESIFLDPELVEIENEESGNYIIADKPAFLKEIYKLVAFNYMPHQVKPLFLTDTDSISKLKGSSTTSDAFSFDVHYFASRLENEGLTATKNGNLFKMIHLDGVHGPYTFGEDLSSDPNKEYTSYDEAAGNVTIIKQYIAELKKLNVYDNSTIILMADHGHFGYSQNPLFMIKNAGEHHEMEVSDLSMSYEFLDDIWIALANGESVNSDFIRGCTPEYGYRRFLYYSWDDAWAREYMPGMKEMLCKGVASDPDNLESTGRSFVAESADYTYELGTVLDFYEGRTGFNYCPYGIDYTGVSRKGVLRFDLKGQSFDNIKVTITTADRCGNSSVPIYVGDKLVADIVYDKSNEYSIVIPGELIGDDNMLEIVFDKTFGSTDTIFAMERTPLLLDKIVMESTTEEPDPKKQFTSYAYELGEKLIPDNMNEYATTGLSFSENVRIWTEGYETTFRLRINEDFHNIKWDMSYSTFNGEQPVKVYVNDTILADFTANGMEKRSFIIPGELISDGLLNIKLSLPNAIAPFEVDPSNADQRKIALSFEEMTFSDTNEEVDAEQLSDDPYYKLGTELYFDEKRLSADIYYLSGFSFEESDGTWTDQKTAEMKFLLTDHTGTDLELKMNYVTFNGPQHVTVYANGEKIESYIADGMETKSITIPASCIKDGALQLTFELPDAVSPKELGQSEDARTLALYFESMSIS